MRSLLSLLFVLTFSLHTCNLSARTLVDKLPISSYVLSGYSNPDSVRNDMQRRALHRIEGIWSFPSNGARIVILRHTDQTTSGSEDAMHYRMIVLTSPCRSLRPGTVMGYLSATAKPGVYAAEIYTSGDGGATLRNPKSFTLRLVDDTHLTFQQHSRKIKMNIWRLLPYLSRISLRIADSDAPKDVDGCVRVFPHSFSGSSEPRYL